VLGRPRAHLGLLLCYAAVYRVAGQHQDSLVRALSDGGNAAIEMSRFGFATFIAGICLANRQSPRFARALANLGLVSAAVLVVTAIPLSAEGSFTQFGGGLDIIGGIPGFLWILTLSLAMTWTARNQSSGSVARVLERND
jgi:hypothetical protein